MFVCVSRPVSACVSETATRDQQFGFEPFCTANVWHDEWKTKLKKKRLTSHGNDWQAVAVCRN